MGQKDDLNSQLQVTSLALTWLLPVPSCGLRGALLEVRWSGGRLWDREDLGSSLVS